MKMPNAQPFLPVNIAVLTISDTRTLNDDKSGSVIEERAIKEGHKVVLRKVILDDHGLIREELLKLADHAEVDVVITTGGTGLTGRDVSVEAHKSIYEKEITGFATLFTMISYQKIGASAIQSRACAGVYSGTYYFAVPGSPSACKDAWDGILKSQLNLGNRPCNLVEIMPRLEEHKKIA